MTDFHTSRGLDSFANRIDLHRAPSSPPELKSNRFTLRAISYGFSMPAMSITAMYAVFPSHWGFTPVISKMSTRCARLLQMLFGVGLTYPFSMRFVSITSNTFARSFSYLSSVLYVRLPRTSVEMSTSTLSPPSESSLRSLYFTICPFVTDGICPPPCSSVNVSVPYRSCASCSVTCNPRAMKSPIANCVNPLAHPSCSGGGM